MTIRTLIGYLCLRRSAIHTIANSRSAVWLGLLFVLSAGLAREYDGEDLLHQPWHALIPLAASTLLALILYVLVWFGARCRDTFPASFFGGFPSFLSLYWMTAPLAWLYAIPYEMFLSPAEATAANLWTLGIVSVWRVVIMIRVVSVRYGADPWAALFLVMLFADSVALYALAVVPLPVFSIMGGIRLTPSERLIHDITCSIQVLGSLTWPLWLLLTAISLKRTNLYWLPRDWRHPENPPAARSLWLLATFSLVIWVPILPFTQPAQQLRYRAEQLLRDDKLTEAIEFMSQHDRSDFPPHWDPPPRTGYGETRPDISDVLDALLQPEVSPWVREVYADKARSINTPISE